MDSRNNESDQRYPIGKLQFDGQVTDELLSEWTRDIEQSGRLLREAVAGLSDEQLDTPYRPGGWTIRQVVHHLADANMNGIVRVKLALTEEGPTVKPFDEERWAELGDSLGTPVELSLTLLDGLLPRWSRLLSGLKLPDLERHFVHPVSGVATVGGYLAFCVWHQKHHTAHITALRTREGWV